MLRKFGLWTTMVLFVLGIMVPASYAEDTIKVGIVLPVTGPQAKFGEIEKLCPKKGFFSTLKPLIVVNTYF